MSFSVPKIKYSFGPCFLDAQTWPDYLKNIITFTNILHTYTFIQWDMLLNSGM